MLNFLKSLFGKRTPKSPDEWFDGAQVGLPGKRLKVDKSHPDRSFVASDPSNSRISRWITHFLSDNGEEFVIEYDKSERQKYLDMKRRYPDGGIQSSDPKHKNSLYKDDE